MNFEVNSGDGSDLQMDLVSLNINWGDHDQSKTALAREIGVCSRFGPRKKKLESKSKQCH